MTKFAQKMIKSAAALALGASVLTTAVVSGDASASAKTTCKVSHGKLINAKSKKVIAGFKMFNSVLYKNGKKFTGVYKGKYYKQGELYTGLVKKIYFKKGVKANGTFKGVYYKYGKPFTATGVYEVNGKNVQFKNGKAVADHKAPVITLEGGAKKIYKVKNGEEFTAPKATAKDNLDKTVTVTTKIFNPQGKVIDHIDTTVAGAYKIKYYSKDLASNKSKVTVTVVVEPATTDK